MSAQETFEYTLDNGLKVFIVEDPAASLVSARTYVRAGSIDEAPHLGTGLSHYLEHVVAGGSTSQRSEDAYQDAISHLGGAFNAYTTIDHTSYYINTVPKDLPKAITILSEWMFDCAFDDKEFNRERGVITKEIEKNEANISRKFYQLSQNNFYKNHPIRLPVIGYLEDFKQVKKSWVLDYYKRYYVASNMILVVGGNIDVDKTLAHIKATFGKAPRVAPPQPVVFDEPMPFSTRVVEREDDTSVTNLSIRFATVDLFSDDLYPLDLLEFILGNGRDSVLNKRLVEEKKLAYSVHCSSNTPTLTSGYFDISVDIDYKNKDKVIREILAVIRDIQQGRVEHKRLKRAKKQKLSDDILSVDSIEDKVSRVGLAYLYAYTPNFFQTYVKLFRDINKADVVRVAKQYLDPGRMVVTVLKPREKESPKAQESLAKTQGEGPKKLTLKNGVRVLIFPESSQPRVHSKLFVLGGVRAETEENNGIGRLIASTLGKKSKRYDKAYIESRIEDNGAHLTATVGKNTLYYNLDCLSEDFKSLFPLFINTFIDAQFPKTDVEESKRKVLQWIKQRKDDWYGYGQYTFKKAFYRAHPYGLSSLGESDSIAAVTPKAMQTFFEHLLNPEQMVLCVYGDIDEDWVKKAAEAELGHLQKSPKQYQSAPLPRQSNDRSRSVVVDIPQQVAAIFVGYDGLDYSDAKTLLQLDLFDAVLSGMSYPGGRLHPLLRGRELVYMVHAVNHPGIEPGYFLTYALSSPENIDEVQSLIMGQIKDLKNNAITQEEFEQAIAQMSFYYNDRVASLEALAIITATDELYGRGYDHYKTVNQAIAELDPADVREIASKLLRHSLTVILKPKK